MYTHVSVSGINLAETGVLATTTEVLEQNSNVSLGIIAVQRAATRLPAKLDPRYGSRCSDHETPSNIRGNYSGGPTGILT